MKKLTLAQLLLLSIPVFSHNEDTDSLIATEDGQFWLPKAKGLAIDHARRNGVSHLVITRAEAEASKPGKAPAKTDSGLAELTVAKVKEWAETATIEQLKAGLSEVESKGGKAAIEAKILELEANLGNEDSEENLETGNSGAESEETADGPDETEESN